MGSFARALGFGIGGAMQGYGQGIVEQAKLNWQKMLQEESEQRADARALASDTRRFGFEEKQKGLDRELATKEEERKRIEGQEGIRLKNKEIEAQDRQTTAQREATDLYRRESRGDRLQARQDRLDYQRQQYNLEVRRYDDRAEQVSPSDLAVIKKTEEVVGRELGVDPADLSYEEPDKIEKFNKLVLERLKTPKLAKFYSTSAGIDLPETAAPAPTAAPAAGPQQDLLPGESPSGAPVTAAPVAATLPKPATREEMLRLPPDTEFITPDGKRARTPKAEGATPAAAAEPTAAEPMLPSAGPIDDSIPVGAEQRRQGLGKRNIETVPPEVIDAAVERAAEAAIRAENKPRRGLAITRGFAELKGTNEPLARLIDGTWSNVSGAKAAELRRKFEAAKARLKRGG